MPRDQQASTKISARAEVHPAETEYRILKANRSISTVIQVQHEDIYTVVPGEFWPKAGTGDISGLLPVSCFQDLRFWPKTTQIYPYLSLSFK